MHKAKLWATALMSSMMLLFLLLSLQPLPTGAQGSITNLDHLTLSGDILAAGDGTIGGNLSVGGAIVAADFVTAVADVELPANLIISDSLTVGTDATVTDDLFVTDDALVAGDARVTGALVVTGTSNLLGNVSDGGGAFTVADNVMIDGAADAVQLTVQGHSTQTSNPFVVENSAGVDQFVVSNTGDATVTDDLIVTDDASANDLTVADFVNVTAQSVLTVTMNGWLTPTGSLQPIAAAAPASIDGGTRMAHVTDYLVLVNIGAQSITISETTGLVGTGNLVLAAGDSATYVWANSSWYQVGASNN